MPQIRPFRALRFDPSVVGDLTNVVAPPYDVIDLERRAELVARHPANVVRLDLPAEEAGDEPDERYRRAARTLAAWRSDGTFRKDPHPSIYVYEQTYCVPGTATERTQRGFFGRLRLESFEPGSTVLPHERTLSGPKEDRYKLLRATGVNTSPVVALYRDVSGRSAQLLDDLTSGTPAVDVTDDEGTRHRLWPVPADGAEPNAAVAGLLGLAARGPITIADGHHRYETALRYRDERRMTRSCDEDPGVRLPARAAGRGRRAPDRAADPPPRARGSGHGLARGPAGAGSRPVRGRGRRGPRASAGSVRIAGRGRARPVRRLDRRRGRWARGDPDGAPAPVPCDTCRPEARRFAGST